jgi:succinate-semialdehyde dehydrogenase/glutarate-semialdehyde dehydrogenase
MSYPNTLLHINGEWRPARSGKTLDVVNPATEEVIGTVAHAEKADLDEALAAADKGLRRLEEGAGLRSLQGDAQGGRAVPQRAPTTSPGDDAGTGQAAAGSEDARRWPPPTSSTGSPRKAAAPMAASSPPAPARRASACGEGAGRPGRRLHAVELPDQPGGAQAVRRAAAGCSIIVKAPEETPASVAMLVRAFVDAGLPQGRREPRLSACRRSLANTSSPHPVIRKVTFTGSTPVGKLLAASPGST